MKKRHNPFRHHPALRCYPSVGDVASIDILEIGPGRGDFLFELARENPESVIGAIEIKRKRFEKLIPRLKRHGLNNVVLIQGDARVVLPRVLKEQSIQPIYILFSDPWPKDRHAKHRLFQSYFIQELHRVLAPAGRLILAHDDASYLHDIEQLFSRHPGFTKDCLQDANPDKLFETFYAAKWREEGRKLRALSFRKKSLPIIMKLWTSWRHRGPWSSRNKAQIDVLSHPETAQS